MPVTEMTAAAQKAYDSIASQKQVAAYLNIDPRTLRRWEAKGTGPPRLPAGPGGTRPYSWPAVRDWAKANMPALGGTS